MHYHNSITKILVLTGLLFSYTSTAEKLPVEFFARLPDVSQVTLSPDGKNIASLVRIATEDSKGTAVAIFNIEDNKQRYLTYVDNKKFVINWIKWGNDKTILISAIFPATRYGIKTTETRLMLADVKTGKIKEAIRRKYFERFNYIPQFQDKIVDILPKDEQHFLLALDGANPGEPTVYKFSIPKRGMKSVQSSKTKVIGWKTDRQHNVRIGYYFDKTRYEIIHRHPDTRKWDTLWEFESFSDEQVWPLGFAKDPNLLYVTAIHKGRDAVFQVNLKSPTLEKTLVLADENYDIEGSLIYSNLSGEAIGITQSVNEGFTFWDEKYIRFQKSINKALPETSNFIVSLSQDEQRYVVLSTSDSDPGTYYVGDRKEKRMDAVALRYKNLAPQAMVEKKWIKYQASDGLSIEAALTLPKNRKQGDKLPTIIFPHGGPISHDGDGFDYWTQFFANRGYAVLQMNFRGSSGYGYDFMKAGLKNWGLAMQDDIEDGARWMIKQGYSDPDKLCIVGASYGGYAALMGSVKTPELYQCAISFAGISDIAYLVKSHRNYTNYDVVKEQIGSDKKILRARSPLYHVEKISTPTLLIHGTKDRSVRVEHSRKMHKALVKANKDVEYLELENGTHYLSNEDNRIKAFIAMDKFLQKHLD